MATHVEQSLLRGRDGGFTLPEFAISSVVISVFLGSILVGAVASSQASLRSVTNDYASLIAAIHTYRDRYARLPGDDPTAATRWPSARNGTGDGVIGGQYDDAPPANAATMTVDSTTGETLLFWWHLRLAGLIQGPTSGPGAVAPPTVPMARRIGVQDGYMGLAGLAVCMEGVTPKLASQLETQIDDGNANTGAVRASVLAADGSAATVRDGRYSETGTDLYLVCMSLASGGGSATTTDDGGSKGNGSPNRNAHGPGNGHGNANGNDRGDGNGNSRNGRGNGHGHGH